MKAYIYIRFSTPQQEPGSSKDRQLEACQALIRMRGWEQAELVSDLGVSAWKGKHLSSGSLGKFAKRLRDGDIPPGSIIVVEQLDRLSRQKPLITLDWIREICGLGFKIATATDGTVYDAESLEANLMAVIMILLKAGGANEYPTTLSNRIGASVEKRLKDAREKGTVIYGNVPGWLKVEVVEDRRKIVEQPERVALVREIFDLTVAGVAPWGIASMFNQRGTPSFTGKPWERAYIVKILRSPAVQGDFVVGEGKQQRPTGEIITGYYGSAIVPADIVAQARAMLDRRRRGSGRNSGAVNNLFGQKIRCGHCGGRMMLAGYQSRYLTCYEASRRNGCSQTETFKYKNLETAALDGFLPLALDERFFRQAAKSNSLTREIAEVQKAIVDGQEKANRLLSMLERIDSPTTEAKLAEIESEIYRLNRLLADLGQQQVVAEGIATAEKHLERLVAVREALSHPQDDVRLPARLRVSEALQALVDEVRCDLVGADSKRRFSVIAVGGLHTVTYDNNGKELSSFKPGMSANGDIMISDHHLERHGITPDERLHSYMRRRRQFEGPSSAEIGFALAVDLADFRRRPTEATAAPRDALGPRSS